MWRADRKRQCFFAPVFRPPGRRWPVAALVARVGGTSFRDFFEFAPVVFCFLRRSGAETIERSFFFAIVVYLVCPSRAKARVGPHRSDDAARRERAIRDRFCFA
jgi:hypothetical protein